jgi:hypothetical protein
MGGAGEGDVMTQERLAGFGAAWRAGDIEALMSFMTDDCVFRSSVGPGPGAEVPRSRGSAPRLRVDPR